MTKKHDKKCPQAPRLRFPEFRDEWYSQALGTIASIIKEKAGDKKCTLMSIITGVGLISQVDKFGKTFTFIMTHIWFYAISKKTGDSKMHCRKCGSEAFTKNGFVAGTQRYKCKQCGFQFTRETSHGKPMKDKILALILYLSGMSMNMIGKIVGVSTQSVMRWINMFYEKFAANDESQSNIEEIEVDEMVSYITKKKITSGSGKLLIITLENLSAGNVVIVVPKP